MEIYEITGIDVLFIAITVWFIGEFITWNFHFINQNNTPPAVTGGLIYSLFITFFYTVFDTNQFRYANS